MKYKIGFIGGGNMASAIVKGLISKGIYKQNEILVSVLRPESLDRISQSLGVDSTLDNIELASTCGIVVLAVKPHFIELVLKEIEPHLTSNHIVVSIAAGITLNQIEAHAHDSKCFRAMPNTPAAVNEGYTSICTNVPPSDLSLTRVMEIFNAVGKSTIITESQMHAAIAVHGSSPAYIYMMIEAMGDAGVMLGLSRQQAYEMAAQSLIGASKMVLSTGLHPGALKDQVTSPGGTTIEAVATLEKTGFRNSLIQAMVAAADKSKKMTS